MERKNQESASGRAVILHTGNEIIAGHVKDTNTPFLIDLLRSEGYTAEAGSVVADDLDSTIGALTEARLKGYGLVVTTGGTGAETTDFLVHGVQAWPPSYRAGSEAAINYVGELGTANPLPEAAVYPASTLIQPKRTTFTSALTSWAS